MNLLFFVSLDMQLGYTTATTPRGGGGGGGCRLQRSLILILILSVYIGGCSPPEDPVSCSSGTTNCTLTNSYGSFPDRTTCRAVEVVYPASEADLLSAVAMGSAARRKMKAATHYSHSIPKLACPGGDDGIIISTRFLNRTVSIDASEMLITVESGVTLKYLIAAAARAGLALPYTPYWWGLTIGGLLATGAHGSSLWGKGSAIHEYVVALRIVTPASREEGYAKVRSLELAHPDMDAAKVSLGVLGVISQVTIRLQPLFKRSIAYSESSDADLAERAPVFGNEHEFADMRWYPGHRRVIYRIDDRVSSNVTGDGRMDFIGFRATPTLALFAARSAEEILEATGDARGKCIDSKVTTTALAVGGYGMTNNGILFTGYPVVGYQNRLQSSGSCLDGHEDALLTACPWDRRVKAGFFHQTTFSIGLSRVRDFILDVQKLRDMIPEALCSVELYDGFLMRYVKASTAYMGKQAEDQVDFDITYYRSHDPLAPRLHENVLEEIEQMGVFKYGGLPHWGKNRNLVFDGVVHKYARAGDFLRVKGAYDPQRLFSSEWTDQILGIEGKTPTIVREGCALEGLCICSEDLHCSPAKGYLCRPGKVYKDARVCTRV